MQPSWLTYKITTKISDTKFQESGVEWDAFTDPFTIAEYDWPELKKEMIVGDELWLYSSPDETWRMLSGRCGVCIVRDGEIVNGQLAVLS